MNNYESEARFEKRFIEQLETLGFKYKKIDDYDEMVENFKICLEEFNKDVITEPLSNSEFIRVLNYLCGKTVFKCAKQLRDKFVLDLDNGKQIYISFFSEDPEKNIYQIANQISTSDKYKNRYDVTVLINGLPLIQIELKRAGIDINEAINQINRYKLHSYKGLFHYIQLFVVSNSVETRYFSNTDETRFLKSLTFYWTDENNNRICNMDDFSNVFFNKEKLIKLLNNYMVISESEKNLMVMRPYQIYATENVVRRAVETDKGGFIWHTTGSGKTLTSFKCAQLLIKEPSIKKVVFLVDRTDLDQKTIDDFNTYEKDSVDMTDHTGVLIKQLSGKDKLIVTTIQKMSNAIKDKYSNKVAHLKNEKIIFIFDECHRSQAGEMHSSISKYFDKAQFFGFTGTPIFIENLKNGIQTTADLFGKCLHQYLISNAIADRNVLGFNIEYKKTFNGKYSDDDDTLVEDINKKEVFESEERISLIANDIVVNHNAKTNNRNYTAIFATASIPVLVKYYDEFKKIDHSLKIGAVFSYNANENIENKLEHSRDQLERIIKDYNRIFDTNFSVETFSAYNRDISNRLKKKNIPQLDILIVVNMYLTGFDSRPLNTLYVDKNLEYHSLLQAFSRTNRVEKETKQFGNIVCYRNLKQKTDAALTLFSGGGNTEEVLIKPLPFYIEQFKELTCKLHEIASEPSVLSSIIDENIKAKFILTFKELSKKILTMQTFSEFDWDDLDKYITRQDYENYKSWYLTFHDEVKNRNESEKTSILDNIDFSIELMQVDKINVSYIMNLIKNIDLNNKDNQRKDISNINKELGRATDNTLRKKIELIKQFLDNVLPKILPDDDIIEAYSNFEEKERNIEINSFISEKNLKKDEFMLVLMEYEFSKKFDDKLIRMSLPEGLTFLTRNKIIRDIQIFIKNNCEKYQ